MNFNETADTCFGAYQTITIAGDGNMLNIRRFKSKLYCRKLYRFLPGFYSYEGSKLTAYITPTVIL
jgi:hypothetical protein